jgi:ATP-dependent DNA helicase Rep/DNA helicase-2/ATP-dependent DNA helicase PcrA
MAIIKKYKMLFETMTLTQALGALVGEIAYWDFIDKSYDSPKIASRKREDVKNFLMSTDRFVDRFGEEASLKNYLERLLLVDNQDKLKDDDGAMKNEVQLMTLHASKGLEFDTCFIIGMEEELLPHKNVIKENGDIDEERRLCYVGITRAKRRLIMTYAKLRKLYGKELKRSPSRFLVNHTDYYTEQDRNSFSHLSEEEEKDYKSNFFSDLLSSLDD